MCGQEAWMLAMNSALSKFTLSSLHPVCQLMNRGLQSGVSDVLGDLSTSVAASLTDTYVTI